MNDNEKRLEVIDFNEGSHRLTDSSYLGSFAIVASFDASDANQREYDIARRFDCTEDKFGNPHLTYKFGSSIMHITNTYRKSFTTRPETLITEYEVDEDLVGVTYILPINSAGYRDQAFAVCYDFSQLADKGFRKLSRQKLKVRSKIANPYFQQPPDTSTDGREGMVVKSKLLGKGFRQHHIGGTKI